MIINPQTERLPRGGADTWDDGLAGAIFSAEVFQASAEISEPVYAGRPTRAVGPSLPFQSAIRAASDPVVGGGNVSVTLTGVAVSTSLGAISPATVVGLAGQASTVSAGAVAAAVSKALTGQSATASIGTVVPAVAVVGTGQGLAASQGVLAPSAVVGLAGQAASIAQGSVSALNDTPQPVGKQTQVVGPAMPFQAMRRNAERVNADVTISLTGISLTTYAGDLAVTVQQPVGRWLRSDMMGPALDFQPSPRSREYTAPASPDVSVSLNGQAVTVSAGTLTPALAKALTGQAATVSSGTITPATDKAITGQSLTASQGTVTPATAVTLNGSALTVSQGNVSASVGGNVSVTLSGVVATTAMGTLTPANVVAITGLAATVSQGSVKAAVSIALSGQQVTAYTGTLFVQALFSTPALFTASGDTRFKVLADDKFAGSGDQRFNA